MQHCVEQSQAIQPYKSLLRPDRFSPSHLDSFPRSSTFSSRILNSARSASSSFCAAPPLAVTSVCTRARFAASSVRASCAVSLQVKEHEGAQNRVRTHLLAPVLQPLLRCARRSSCAANVLTKGHREGENNHVRTESPTHSRPFLV